MPSESDLPLPCSFLQLVQRHSVFVVIGNAAVPLRRVLHEADSFAFGGTGDDDYRPPVDLIGAIERIQNLTYVVAMDLDDMPVECSPLIRDRFSRHHGMGGAGLLHSVVVDDDRSEERRV